jgi:hypothetical protein
MIFTSRHLSRRNFQLFDSQSTVNSQHHSGATGNDIIETSIDKDSGFSTDFFHTQIKQRQGTKFDPVNVSHMRRAR